MAPCIPASANEVFQRYLAAAEQGEDAEDLLARLMVEFAQPLVGRVIRRRLSSARGANLEDIQDVSSEALASLVSRLRAMRAQPGRAEVADFEAYAAGLASHVAFQFFAARCPERSRLRGRIRYVLTTDSRFRIWSGEHGASVCALERHGQRALVAPGSTVEQCRRSLAARSLPAGRLPVVVHMVLSELNGAIELGDLTSLIADLLGVEDRSQPVGDLSETLADPRAPHSERTELRDSLQALWIEIKELPLSQRIALLLNLRSTSGAGVWLFTELGIVGFRDLASSVGMTAEALAALWNRLPLEDSEIAARSGLERQQVINMRSAARQRLLRRSKKRERNTVAGNISGFPPTN